MINIINEEKEKDKKENIIVHGLEECSNETEDVETVLELVDSVENLNSAGDVVVEVIRLGKKETGKTRPMKIVFKHGTGMKNKMFKHKESKRLPEKYSHLKFVSDRTRQEREDFKALYQTLNARKAAGETGIAIRGMKIVKINPGTGSTGPGVFAGTQPGRH